VCLFSVLCVVITCVLMTYVEHDPMMEIVAKPLYVTLLEHVLEFRRSEPAFRVTVSKDVLEFPPLRAGVTRYVAFLWGIHYGMINTHSSAYRRHLACINQIHSCY
jgi:hypothetical protein